MHHPTFSNQHPELVYREAGCNIPVRHLPICNEQTIVRIIIISYNSQYQQTFLVDVTSLKTKDKTQPKLCKLSSNPATILI